MSPTTQPTDPTPSTTSLQPPLSTILNTHDFETIASQTLTPKTWAFYSSAATDMITYSSNKTIYDRILLRPRILRNVTTVSTRTRILGCDMNLPLFVSPAAMATLVHPDGEIAIARGCAKYGIGQCVCTHHPSPFFHSTSIHPYIKRPKKTLTTSRSPQTHPTPSTP